jgi:hypothetical protein
MVVGERYEHLEGVSSLAFSFRIGVVEMIHEKRPWKDREPDNYSR